VKKFFVATVTVAAACGVALGATALASASEPTVTKTVTATTTTVSSPEPAKDVNEVTNGGEADEHDSGLSGAVVAGVVGVRELAATYNPDVFVTVGTVWPPSESTLFIALTTDDAAIREDFLVASGLPPVQVMFRLAHTSETRSEELFELMDLDRAFWEEQGAHFAEYGIAAETSEFTIGVYNLTERVDALIRHRYGPVDVIDTVGNPDDIGRDSAAP